MLAKAGESDRAIRVKMVGVPSLLSSTLLFTFFSSPSICLRGSGEWEKQLADEAVGGVCILRVFLAFTCANVRFWCKEHTWSLNLSLKQHVLARLDPFVIYHILEPTSTMASKASETSAITALQNWVSDNKKVVIAVSTAAVATAVAVVLYTNAGRPSIEDIEKGDEKKSSKKKKAKSKAKKATEAFDANGPILEEVPKDETPTCKVLH
jgi:Na+/melibiose symporter-like transporter